MDLTLVKDWLVPVSTFVTLVTGSIAGWLSLREYRIKVQAEARLARAEETESDVKLLKLFTEIMDIAHSRRSHVLSEKAVERMLSPDMYDKLNLNNLSVKDILASAVVILPVGAAAQDAAISAIAELGEKHPNLRQVAIQALESLQEVKPDIAKKNLDRLRQL